MSNFVQVTGMVMEVSPVNDYDRRLVILTKERGKITAFCRGARRVNNRLMAAANQFAFGTFKLIEGRNSYNLTDAEISNYFEELRTDFEGAYLAMYFIEIASYYSRENNDEVELLKLLYQSLRAIIKSSLNNKLVRAIYEIKAIVVNGEFPGVPDNMKMSETARYTVDFICKTKPEKLYTFTVNDDVIDEVSEFSSRCIDKLIDKKFKSIEILDSFI